MLKVWTSKMFIFKYFLLPLYFDKLKRKKKVPGNKSASFTPVLHFWIARPGKCQLFLHNSNIFLHVTGKYFWTHLIPNIFLLSVWWYFLMLVSTSSVIEIMNQIFWGDLRLPQDVHTTNNQYIVKKYIQSVMNVVLFPISGGWCWCQKNNLLNLLLQFSWECVFSVFLLFLSKLGNWI